MKNPVYESMTALKIKIGPWEDDILRIRVWRTEQPEQAPRTVDLQDKIKELQKQWGEGIPQQESGTLDFMWRVAAELGNLNEVAAVEVLKKNGNGVIFYPDWT